jgi:large subunit ribosomal protein L15
MKLSSLRPAEGSVKVNRRLGRGHGSGFGATASRGHKGAKSRSGYSQKKGFEGGQMPLQRRVPKFGFKNFNRVEYKAINLDALQALIDKTNASIITLGTLQANGLTSKSDLVKVLGRGELKSAVEVRVNAFSASAVEAIEKAGGKAVVDSTFSTEGAVVATKTSVPATKAPKAKEVAAPVAEEVATEATPAKSAKASKKSEGDDLKLIEGIGPKIAELFINAGIDTFAKLADSSVEQMKEILTAAGSRYASHDPGTWADQAALARDGKMDELKELQDRLNGGKA